LEVSRFILPSQPADQAFIRDFPQGSK
jgi:hypothetical protein